MLCPVYLHLLFLLLPAWSRSAVVTQWGNRLTVAEGKTAEMHCFQNDTNENYMYWYRQHSGAGLQLIVTSVGTSDSMPEDGFKERFKATRPDLKTCSLKILRVDQTDRAVYYCAASDHSDSNRSRAASKTYHPLILRNSQALAPGFQLKHGPTGGGSIELTETVTGVTVNLKNKQNCRDADQKSFPRANKIVTLYLQAPRSSSVIKLPVGTLSRNTNGLQPTNLRLSAEVLPTKLRLIYTDTSEEVVSHTGYFEVLPSAEMMNTTRPFETASTLRNIKRNCRQNQFLEDMLQVLDLLFTNVTCIYTATSASVEKTSRKRSGLEERVVERNCEKCSNCGLRKILYKLNMTSHRSIMSRELLEAAMDSYFVPCLQKDKGKYIFGTSSTQKLASLSSEEQAAEEQNKRHLSLNCRHQVKTSGALQVAATYNEGLVSKMPRGIQKSLPQKAEGSTENFKCVVDYFLIGKDANGYGTKKAGRWGYGENDTIRPAKVTVFEPSPEEIREKKKATVVCLVSDFYPDNIKIHWLVDGKEKDANDTNIHTDLNAILSKENTSYSISSRLRFDALDWARSKNVECRVDLYTNESVPATSSSTLAVKAEMCGISKEAKIQSMATAKLTYLILICKSIFYAIFISTIAWKTKTSYSKRFD
ncbi:uncharacterized protein [Heterodontus francisci]|uniref:uncharacterized protein n=1 Tax=Heterodontus francisci TaxID=7792 RepID=UPI00355B6115